jgi:hypothetical protein
MSFASEATGLGGTLVKSWNQDVYMRRFRSRVGLCRAISLTWLRFKKENNTKELYDLGAEALEDVEWLNNVHKGSDFISGSAYSYGNEVFDLLTSYMKIHGMAVVKPYIAKTPYSFFPRGYMTLRESIDTATAGFGYFALLDMDHPGEGEGHAVATYVMPGGSSFFFDPNFGEVKFPDPYRLRTFLNRWLSRNYPTLSQTSVERFA